MVVDEATAIDISYGRPMDAETLGLDPAGLDVGGPWPVLGPDGSLLAVYGPHGDRPGRVKPVMVLAPAP
jgi:hypothetical protein